MKKLKLGLVGVVLLGLTSAGTVLLGAEPALAYKQGCAQSAHQHYISEAYTNVTDFRTNYNQADQWDQHRIWASNNYTEWYKYSASFCI
jgi:hypothetical protein